MYGFSENEMLDWLKEKIITANYKKDFVFAVSKVIPQDAGRKNHIAKSLSQFDYGRECLLVINEYGIWPSSENLDLFYAYRKSVGILSSLDECSAHLIRRSDNIELYCILCMILYFSWGAILFSESSDTIISISHNERLDVYFKNELCIRNELVEFVNSI
jgi:hypothetical protein